MALGAKIYKVNLSLSNFSTHLYKDIKLVLTKHPSENESRMMYRFAAYLYCYHQELQFTKGLSTPEEPEIWQKNYAGEIEKWIELGTPDIKRIRQACGKSYQVFIFTYNESTFDEYFEKFKNKLQNYPKLEIIHIHVSNNGPLEKLVQRSMKLSCTIEEHIMHLGDDHGSIELNFLKPKNL